MQVALNQCISLVKTDSVLCARLRSLTTRYSKSLFLPSRGHLNLVELPGTLRLLDIIGTPAGRCYKANLRVGRLLKPGCSRHVSQHPHQEI
uniref:AlNc14C326G10648 protein n=1 Tax=Albugo laibachii Nc14 TaxID=890382 RepID=F0WGE3_9STRA|nr:AlNc14C91G5675 [Albugo laibachii Nc14]CCA25860.1 AlNc14C326G10648 [Albugo laibachii Nc14]|eukprot:CCA25860.1 AlNc14C326G10648 [Albugo laibachii Nc14]